MKAGMIGLGAMGEGMARNLAAASYLTGVYNRTQDKAQKLAHELNVRHFRTVEDLSREANVILLCVSADQDVLGLVNKVAVCAEPDSVVIDMSTVSSETAIKAAELLSTNQIAFLDAPVSGGVEGAKKGTLAMMVGGQLRVLHQVTPILEAMSSRIQYMGPTGSGQATKAVNQIMAAGINQAVTEALAFGQAQGLPMDKLIEVISGGAAGNWFLEHRGLTMTHGTFKPGFKLALHQKDLNICKKMAEQIDIKLPIAEKTISDYQRLISQGYGNEDISALYRMKRGSE